MTQFVSLSSGSNGNCYYIGNDRFGILIDAGIGTRTIKKRLAERGLSVDSVRCVLVSHDHFDHIRSLGTFSGRFQRPVYATEPCISAFSRHYCTREFLDKSQCRRLVAGEWLRLDGDGDCGCQAGGDSGCDNAGDSRLGFAGSDSGSDNAGDSRLGGSRGWPADDGVWVLPFGVPHDATDTVGFFIRFYGETFTFLTDLGAVTEDAVRYAARARHLIVEANYDPEMLRRGPYPLDLQQRIRNGHGHLANAQTAELIRQALTLNQPSSPSPGEDSDACPDERLRSHSDERLRPHSDERPGLQDVFLCHLSENNNTHELALAAVSSVLPSGIRLVALPRREASDLFTWQ